MKTILVTGATRGVGLAVARRLAKLSDTRVVGISRKASPEFTDLCRANEGRVHFVAHDLADLESLHELVRAVTKAHGNLYGLVNNAAAGVSGVLATMHERDIADGLRINLASPILLSKYAARSMLLGGSGRIVNVTSIVAATGFNGLSVYAAAKAGLMGFTRSLARELGRAKITVNCVAPGYMETAMTKELQGEALESIRRRSPLGRLPDTEDAAAAICYLLSDDASGITGTTLTVDAGSTA